MAMGKKQWYGMCRALKSEGWQVAAEISNRIDKVLFEKIEQGTMDRYPEDEYERKFYFSPSGYKTIFVRKYDVEVLDPMDHEFYQQAHAYRERMRRDQILKGAEKYPTLFNPDDWTDIELLDHAMQENVDQGHYIVGLGMKNKKYREQLQKIMVYATALKEHLDISFEKVEGMSEINPIRVNHLRAINGINAIIEEVKAAHGTNEDK